MIGEAFGTVAAVVAVLVAFAWYLSYSAARLDRLHAKVEGALAVLDAQCVRRAETALELANSGALNPASSLLVASAASESLERHTEHPGEDWLDGQHFGGREAVEADLTEALRAALDAETVSAITGDEDSAHAKAVARCAAAGERVQMARRFHNEAVREVRRVRAKTVVRAFRLAGHAALPEPVDFPDDLPGPLQR